jgi:hypothetical protein
VVDDIAIVPSQLKVFVFLHFPADNAINAAFYLETAKLEKGHLCFGFTFPVW